MDTSVFIYRTRTIWSVFGGLCVILFVAPTFGQGPQTASEDSLLKLSKTSFSDRQAAMRLLWETGDQRLVEAAAQDVDPEVRLRANWILNQWKLGIRPNTPPEIAGVLRGTYNAATIDLEDMILAGKLDALVDASRENPDLGIKRLLQSELLRELPYFADLCLKLGETESLVRMLGELSDIPIVAIRRAQLMRELGYDPEACVVLTKSAQSIRTSQRKYVEVLMRWYIGMHEQAIDLARQDQSGLLPRLLFAAEDWQGLAEVTRELADKVEIPTEPIDRVSVADKYLSTCAIKIGHLQLLLVGLYRGQAQEFEATLDEMMSLFTKDHFTKSVRLLKANKQASRAQNLAFETAELLIAIDQPLLAVKILWDHDELRAAELLAGRFEYAKAFEVLGINDNDLDESLISLARTAAKEALQIEDEEQALEQRSRATTAGNTYERCLFAAKQAWKVGHGNAARSAMRILAQMPNQNDQDRRVEIIEAALYQGDREFAYQIAEPLLLSDSLHPLGAEALFRSTSGSRIWNALTSLAPGVPLRRRAEMLVDLSLGVAPQFEDPQDASQSTPAFTFDRLANQLHLHMLQEPFEAEVTHELGELCQRFGRFDLAATFFAAFDDGTEFDSQLALAEMQFRMGATEVAAEMYRELWHQFPNEPESRVGLAASLRLLGQEDDASAIEKRLDLLPLDPEQYIDVANQYRVFNNHVSARRFAEKVIASTPTDASRAVHYRALTILLSIDKGDSLETLADLHRRRIDRTLGSTMLGDMAYYSSITFDMHQSLARAALRRSDHESAQKHIALALQQVPANIDFGETELVEIREQGHEDFANRTFDSIFASASRHISKFPLHANMMNNTAWIASLHKREIKKGLEFSRRAVALYPATFSYRDTLADILFQNEMIEQAIQVEANCLYDVPDDYHVHKQLERFREATGAGVKTD